MASIPKHCSCSVVLSVLLLLAATDGHAADVLQASNTAPVYQLSNLRLETDRFGGELIVFDYKLLRGGKGTARIAGKTDKGAITVAASIPAGQQAGTIQLQSFFPTRGNGTQHLELYLYQSVAFMKGGSTHMLLSNPVRIGNPGPTTVGKAWTRQQIADHSEYVRVMNDDSSHKPDKSYPVSVKLPEDHAFIPNTAKLVKGTKLFACYQDGWHNLTAISENADSTINVRWVQYGPSSDCAMSRGELIASNDVLASLEKHTANKYPATKPNIVDTKDPKMKAAPATTADGKPIKRYAVTIHVPADSILVPEDFNLVEGIPLQACYAGKWNPITALSQNKDGTLYVRWNDYGSAFDCNMLRSELIIKKDLVAKIKANPDFKPSIPPLKRKSYPISVAIPADSQLVPDKVELPKGTKLQACWAGKWNAITCLSVASDGTLNIHWDDFGSGFDCSMLRSELIVKKADLAKISSDAPMADLSKPRIWTDSTGKFTIKASLKTKTASEVTFLTDDGREIKLPISRLSKEGQNLLKGDESNNPFK